MKAITGNIIYYYFVCRKQMWYFVNDLGLEKYNEDVKIGKFINDNTYIKNRKEIHAFGNICIDFVENKKIIHEIKKSNKTEKASIYQLKYYLYCLKKEGFEISHGILNYPKLMKKIKVELNAEDEIYLEEVVLEIQNTNFDENKFEALNNKNFCKKCSYYDLCMI